jgi:formyltetrahydrofolate synthetase
VIVATVRALKYHGGVPKKELGPENLEALEKGLPNLLQHVENVTKVFGVPAVVALNRFPTDTEAEIKLVEEKCNELGVNVVLSEVWAKGGEGGEDLAREVVRLCDEGDNRFGFVYDLDMTIKEKIEAVAKRIYRADGVIYSAAAEKFCIDTKQHCDTNTDQHPAGLLTSRRQQLICQYTDNIIVIRFLVVPKLCHQDPMLGCRKLHRIPSNGKLNIPGGQLRAVKLI